MTKNHILARVMLVRAADSGVGNFQQDFMGSEILIVIRGLYDFASFRTFVNNKVKTHGKINTVKQMGSHVALMARPSFNTESARSLVIHDRANVCGFEIIGGSADRRCTPEQTN